MWKLENVQAKNFCSFEELNFSIPQNVTTLVFGNNLDNSSQGSNGSGKSALVEMISLGLTGETLRQVTADEIIRDGADIAFLALHLVNPAMSSNLLIERTLSRKQPQVVRIFLNNEEVPVANVLEANKFILELIDLSKDDLYANFILSKRKYVSFLSSSDKDKKELINRFSNGNLVDESIAALETDIEPLTVNLNETEQRISYLRGSLASLDEQITSITQDADNSAANRKERIAGINQQLADCHRNIREINSAIDSVNVKWDKAEAIDSAIANIEDENLSFEETAAKIQEVWDTNIFGTRLDTASNISVLKSELQQLNDDLIENKRSLDDCAKDKADIDRQIEAKQKAFAGIQTRSNAAIERMSAQIRELTVQSEEASATLSDLFVRRQKGQKYVSDLQTALSGAIVCPKCNHSWVVDSELSKEQMEEKLAGARKRQQEIEASIEHCQKISVDSKKSIQELNDQRTALTDDIDSMQHSINKLSNNSSLLNNQIGVLKGRIDAINEKIAIVSQRINNAKEALFESVFDHIGCVMNQFDQAIKSYQHQIATVEGSIATLEASRKQLEEYSVSDVLTPLYKSKERIEQELAEKVAHYKSVECQINALNTQKTRFIEFKTYLANTKIEALAATANQFLEAIGSDIRMSFSGITMLKSGKIRDKISISLLRDGVDRGSFGKFSQGERSRCELATILALQKLTNTTCEDGKGLDLLVVDEVLDGVDEDGLTNIFETLNSLGITSLIVSHGLIQENYQHRLIINKQNGVSFI